MILSFLNRIKVIVMLSEKDLLLLPLPLLLLILCPLPLCELLLVHRILIVLLHLAAVLAPAGHVPTGHVVVEEVEVFRGRYDYVVVGRDLRVQVLVLVVTHYQLVREVADGRRPRQQLLVVLRWQIVLDDIAEGLRVQVRQTLQQLLTSLILLD